MKPLKPMDRGTYLEWCKDLPKDICFLCEWKEWQLVLREYKRWVLVYSCAPYKQYNMMLIPKRHVEYMHDLSLKEIRDLKEATKDCYDTFHKLNDASEYIWLWRTRDANFDKEGTKKKGKRLPHLHVHFMPESSRWLDPALNSDAADEAVFNKIKEVFSNEHA